MPGMTTASAQARRAGGDPAGAPLPAARALLFAVTSTALAATGHHLASGDPVPWRTTALAVLVLSALGVLGVRRPPSLPVVLAAVLAAQAGLHLALTRASGNHGAHAARGRNAPGPHSGPGHGPPSGMSTDGAADTEWHGGHGPAMVAAHLAAAVLVAWLLHRADAALGALSRTTRGTGRILLGALAQALGHKVPATGTARLRPRLRQGAHRGRVRAGRQEVLAYAMVRRGPPRTTPV